MLLLDRSSYKFWKAFKLLGFHLVRVQENYEIAVSMELKEETSSSRTWWSDLKKWVVKERVLTWSSSIVTVVCFLMGTVLVLSLKTPRDPYSVLVSWPWRVLPELPGSVAEQVRFNVIGVGGEQLTVQEDGYLIWQTGIRGKEAVDKFRDHLDCFSIAGQWEYDQMPRKLPWVASTEFRWASVCDWKHVARGGIYGESADSIALSNDPGLYGNWSVREELKWVWRTNDSSCPWHPIDRDNFCRRIGSNRNILVVGDSINHQITASIRNALAVNSSSVVNQQLHPGEELCTDVLDGVGKGFVVEGVRNDYISLVTEPTMGNRVTLNPWMPILQNDTSNFKILVLNRGAHYVDDQELVTGLRTTFSFLRDSHPELIVIFRNTITGHEHCTENHEPLKTPWIGGGRPEWHWGEFYRQNLISKAIVEEYHYIYLDVSRAIGMRAEGHFNPEGGDCLHYCAPGPLDFAVEMIYNALLLL